MQLTPSSTMRSRTVACRAQAAPLSWSQSRRAVLGAGLGLALLVGQPSASQAVPNPNLVPAKEVDNDSSPYIQELLKRTEEKREERRKERLNDYYRRNFKEYMDFEAGVPGVARRRGITDETQQKIAKWLEENQ
mmetsp:Transcript_8713/g.21581  ORF Transcript_8713/g.21581 Transcript_8713/m.21581 type:complete len:134 (-) Transcript_8713:364-765(-)|eukprot:CAMPEP_0202866760 /NCGR_PEP_ID=MMETSP1391-20130828/8346_1 /ASSEMBLY_ACC=CAM_ASM_000867 /TAXON_ID=1034604 /ORGANISM="Chlamydomonas leiostraca, Strain SAG 11-49" /LENGTH=133 /DNA_ID=CAMNT_0049546741 /DNA_START=25 /DNA_END=426 /DNA_ORIENTATION=-